MEAQETKSITESSLNLLKQYLIDMALIPILKWLLLRKLPDGVKQNVQKLHDRLSDKYGNAVKKVEKDGNTKQKDFTDDLSFEEWINMSEKADEANIKHFGLFKNTIASENAKEASNDEIRLDNKARIQKFREAKTNLDNAKERLDNYNRKGVTGSKLENAEKEYNKALAEWNNQRKAFEGKKFVFVCNVAHQKWAKEQFDVILQKREEAFSSAKSNILKETIENERNNASDYDKEMADAWVNEQIVNGEFDGKSSDEIEIEIKNHFEKSGLDGTAEKSAFKDRYYIHTVSGVDGAKIANTLYQRESNKSSAVVEFYVEHDKTIEGKEIARIYIKDDDFDAYKGSVNIHQGEIKHNGSSNNKANNVSDFDNKEISGYRLNENVSLSTINDKLKDYDYEIRYKRDEETNSYFPVIYVDKKLVQSHLQEEINKEQALTSLQQELDDKISQHYQSINEVKSDNSIELKNDNINTETNIEVTSDSDIDMEIDD